MKKKFTSVGWVTLFKRDGRYVVQFMSSGHEHAFTDRRAAVQYVRSLGASSGTQTYLCTVWSMPPCADEQPDCKSYEAVSHEEAAKMAQLKIDCRVLVEDECGVEQTFVFEGPREWAVYMNPEDSIVNYAHDPHGVGVPGKWWRHGFTHREASIFVENGVGMGFMLEQPLHPVREDT